MIEGSGARPLASAFIWSQHAKDDVRRLPLRAHTFPRHRGPLAHHRVQLLDLHQEGLSAFDRAAGAVRASQRCGRAHHLRFNTGTAKHTFCSTCGIHAFYVPRSDPDKIDVNVRCLDDVDIAAIKPHTFDGQNWEQSMAGRVPWK